MKSTVISAPIIIFSVFGFALLSIIVIVTLFRPGQFPQSEAVSPVDMLEAASAVPDSSVDAGEIATERPETANVQFTLETVARDGRFGFIGIGGEIDGVLNPDLVVQPGDVVQLTLLNGDGLPHDLVIPDFDVKLPYVSNIGDLAEVTFAVDDTQLDSYVYYCTVPGHRQLGQEGRFIVREVSK
ncbi:MAG TPA: cupredoxin domain-containing protein [Anaerolineales bacterium]